MSKQLDFSYLDELQGNTTYLLNLKRLREIKAVVDRALRADPVKLQRHILYHDMLRSVFSHDGDFRGAQEVHGNPEPCPCLSCLDCLAWLQQRQFKEAKTQKQSKREKPGFIYLLKCGQYCKIGRTKSVPSRLSALSIQLPERAELIHSFPTNRRQEAEARLHEQFSSQHINGEWFELTEEDISKLKTITEMNFTDERPSDGMGNREIQAAG
jgi:hypothetical protein